MTEGSLNERYATILSKSSQGLSKAICIASSISESIEYGVYLALLIDIINEAIFSVNIILLEGE